MHAHEAVVTERGGPEEPFSERFRQRPVQSASDGLHLDGELLCLRLDERPQMLRHARSQRVHTGLLPVLGFEIVLDRFEIVPGFRMGDGLLVRNDKLTIYNYQAHDFALEVRGGAVAKIGGFHGTDGGCVPAQARCRRAAA